jgi:hypothetical protein
MITLEESLALLKEIQDKAPKAAQRPDAKPITLAEWDALLDELATIPPDEVARMTQAIHQAFPINYLTRDEEQ